VHEAEIGAEEMHGFSFRARPVGGPMVRLSCGFMVRFGLASAHAPSGA
jgi:hypothetical protein